MRTKHEGVPKAVHALLQKEGAFTQAEACREAGAGGATVHRHLTELVHLGLLHILNGGPLLEYAWASPEFASWSLAQFRSELRARRRPRHGHSPAVPPPPQVVARHRENGLEVLVPNVGVRVEEADPALSLLRSPEGGIAGFQVKDYERHFFRTALGGYLFDRNALTVNLVLSTVLLAVTSEIERKGKARDPETLARLLRLESHLMDLRRALGPAEIAYESEENRTLLRKRPK